MRYLKVILLILLVVNVTAFAKVKKKKKAKGKKADTELVQLAESYFVEGMKQFILNNHAKAITWFQESLKLQANNSAVYYQLAKVYAMNANHTKALIHIQNALKLNNKNKYYYLLKVEILDRLKEYNNIIETYLALIENVEGTKEYYLEIGTIYLFTGKYDEALTAFDQYQAAFGINKNIVLQKQQIFLKQNKIENAIAQSKLLIHSFPHEPEHVISLAELLQANEKDNDAKIILDSLVLENEDAPLARLMLYEILKSQDSMELAKVHLVKAFESKELDPNTKSNIIINLIRQFSDTTLIPLAYQLSDIGYSLHPNSSSINRTYANLILQTSKNIDSAAVFIKRSLKIDPSDLTVWQQILMIYSDSQELDSLITYAEKAIEVFPNQAFLYYYLGTAHMLKKDNENAVSVLEQAKRYSGSNQQLKLQILAQLGDTYHSLDQYDKSYKSYESALLIDPNNAHVLNNYSYFLSLENNKLEKAKEMSSKLIKMHPDEPTYLDTYAWVLYKLKDYEGAKVALEKAIANTENGTIIEHYGDVLFKLGEKDKAIEQWKKAKGLGEESEFIDKKIADEQLYE